MGRKMTRRVPAVCSGLEPFQLAANEDRKGGLGWGQENSRIKKYQSDAKPDFDDQYRATSQ